MLARTFGCARFVFNSWLRLRTDAHRKLGEHFFYSATSAALTPLKQQEAAAWLNEVSCVPPEPALRHLDKAFKNFFEGRARYPRYKKKHGRQAAEYTISAFTSQWHASDAGFDDRAAAESVESPLPEGDRPSTVTVTKDQAGLYFVSLPFGGGDSAVAGLLRDRWD